MRGATARQLRRLAGSDRGKFKRLKKGQNNKFRPSTYKPEDHNVDKGWNREQERRYKFAGTKVPKGYRTHQINHNVPTSSDHSPSHDAKESNHARTIRTQTTSGRRVDDEVTGIQKFKHGNIRSFRNGKEVGDGRI